MAETMITVDGVAVPNPSKFEWSLNDVSASTAGRTDDAIMHKDRISQKRKISLSWNIKSWEDTAQIMQAFNPEYFDVTYPDMLSGKYETRTFYRSDPSAPVKMWLDGKKRIETISFNIIER